MASTNLTARSAFYSINNRLLHISPLVIIVWTSRSKKQACIKEQPRSWPRAADVGRWGCNERWQPGKQILLQQLYVTYIWGGGEWRGGGVWTWRPVLRIVLLSRVNGVGDGVARFASEQTWDDEVSKLSHCWSVGCSWTLSLRNVSLKATGFG